MITENYSISFLGLDPRYYSIAIIGNIWNIASDKVYVETGIRVSGKIQESYIVGQEDEELNNTIIFTVGSTRVSNEMATSTEYWNAYKEVIEEVRYRLGNPRMYIIIAEINITHFEAI